MYLDRKQWTLHFGYSSSIQYEHRCEWIEEFYCLLHIDDIRYVRALNSLSLNHRKLDHTQVLLESSQNPIKLLQLSKQKGDKSCGLVSQYHTSAHQEIMLF